MYVCFHFGHTWLLTINIQPGEVNQIGKTMVLSVGMFAEQTHKVRVRLEGLHKLSLQAAFGFWLTTWMEVAQPRGHVP